MCTRENKLTPDNFNNFFWAINLTSMGTSKAFEFSKIDKMETIEDGPKKLIFLFLYKKRSTSLWKIVSIVLILQCFSATR